MQKFVILLASIIILSGCVSSQPPLASSSTEPNVLGEWRLRPMPEIPSSYTSFKLVLSKGVLGNTWQFSSSSGSWYVADIEESDWYKWGYEYGYPYDVYGTKSATKKIILEGWAVDGEKNDVDVIVEEDSGEVTSLYVVGEYQMQFSRK